MSPAEYSNSGDQNSASKGQASMQIPQYMHREKSIAKRSSTLRARGRPPSGARHPFTQAIQRRRVRQAEIPGCIEALASRHRHVRLIQQRFGKFRRGADAGRLEGLGGVRETDRTYRMA